MAEIVATTKHPRDWEEVKLTQVDKSDSYRTDIILDRDDEIPDRLRFIVSIGSQVQVSSYSASLLLENRRIRGVDYHEFKKVRYYGKVVVPPGWHEDVYDLTKDQGHDDYHSRLPLEDFAPYDATHFLRMVAKRWNIILPGTGAELL